MNPRRGWVGVGGALGVALACVSEPDVSVDDSATTEWSEQPLVELGEREAWQVVEADDDPLAGHRPTLTDCPAGAWDPDLGQLEVQTGVCNYFALAQPSLVDLDVGDRVIVDLWHDVLDAAEPATGHIAVVIDDMVIGEAEVEIPSEAEVIRFEWIVETPLPAGTPVHLHLHNHGYNSWTFVAIEAELQR